MFKRNVYTLGKVKLEIALGVKDNLAFIQLWSGSQYSAGIINFIVMQTTTKLYWKEALKAHR